MGKQTRLQRLVKEVKRRNLIQVTGWYAGFVALALNLLNHMTATLNMPKPVYRAVALLFVLFYPVVLAMAWAFEITPEGVQRTRAPGEGPPPGVAGARRKKLTTIGLAGVVFLAGLITAYRLDTAGLRQFAESEVPALAKISFLSGQRAYLERIDYRTIEGGADVQGSLRLKFAGRLDPSTVTRDNIRLLASDSSEVAARIRLLPDRKTVEVEPLGRLDYGSAYHVTLSRNLLGVRDRPVLTPASTGSEFTFETQPSPRDRRAPRLAESDPSAGADEVPRDAGIRLRFDDSLDLRTVNEQSVQLLGPGGQAVSSRIFSDSRQELRIEPTERLRPGARYKVRLTSLIADLSGNRMTRDSIMFRTRAPRVARAQPGGPSSPGQQGTPSGSSEETSSSSGSASESPGGPAQEEPEPERVSLAVVPGGLSSDRLERFTVYVDGQQKGSPPVSLQAEGGRSHEIRITGQPQFTGPDRAVEVYRATVPAGASRQVNLQTDVKGFGTMSVNTQPAAVVLVDGRQVGTTPPGVNVTLVAGEHTLEVRPKEADADAYGTVERTFTVEPFGSKSLGQIELPPRGGEGGGG